MKKQTAADPASSPIVPLWFDLLDWSQLCKVVVNIQEFKKLGKPRKAIAFLKSEMSRLEKADGPQALVSTLALCCTAHELDSDLAAEAGLPNPCVTYQNSTL